MPARRRTYARTISNAIDLVDPPFWHGLVIRTHGVERIEPGSSGTRQVVVHEYNPYWSLYDEQFEDWVAAMVDLRGDPLPQLRGVYGLNGRPRVLVCDRIEGVTLGQICNALPPPGLPVNIGLAVVHALLPIFRRWSKFANSFSKDNVWLTYDGQVRTWPASSAEYTQGSTSSHLLDDLGPVLASTYGPAPPADNVIVAGVLLHELLVGELLLWLYPGDCLPENIFNLRKDGPIPIRTKRPDASEVVARFIDGAVARSVRSLQEKPDVNVTHDSFDLDSWDELDDVLGQLRSTYDPVGPDQLRSFVESLPQCPPVTPKFRPPRPDELPDVEYEPIPWDALRTSDETPTR